MDRSGASRWLACGLLLVLVGAVAVWLRRDDEPDPVAIRSLPPGNPVQWSGIDVAGDGLTVSYGGSPCQESSGAFVDELDDRVVVTVYVEPAPGACAQMLQRHSLEVRLGQSLGDRPVYDGACLEQAVDPAAMACRRWPAPAAQ
ncbi:MAG TPA: hypothetical protein VM575_00160 [Nocardioides sp.]|nr:hypothetical protein [Nocardioides sp.]